MTQRSLHDLAADFEKLAGQASADGIVSDAATGGPLKDHWQGDAGERLRASLTDAVQQAVRDLAGQNDMVLQERTDRQQRELKRFVERLETAVQQASSAQMADDATVSRALAEPLARLEARQDEILHRLEEARQRGRPWPSWLAGMLAGLVIAVLLGLLLDVLPLMDWLGRDGG